MAREDDANHFDTMMADLPRRQTVGIKKSGIKLQDAPLEVFVAEEKKDEATAVDQD